MPSSRAVLPALVALALVPGCGADPVRIASRTLTVRLDEYRLVPQDVRVRAGRLRLVGVNVGRLTHNLRIVRQDPESAEAPPIEVGGTQTAQPGDTVTATLPSLRPGRYRIICSIANHDDLGQYGTLIARR